MAERLCELDDVVDESPKAPRFGDEGLPPLLFAGGERMPARDDKNGSGGDAVHAAIIYGARAKGRRSLTRPLPWGNEGASVSLLEVPK